MNHIPIVERMPRGLLFGGFTSPDERHEEYAKEIHTDSEMVVQGIFNGIEPFRSFGNHRIATHIRRQGWDVEDETKQ